MKKIARWSDWNSKGLEHCFCCQDSNGLILEGVVAGTRDGQYGGHYRVCTDADFRTRSVWVKYVNGPELHLESDGEGHWRDLIEDRTLPALDNCIDVDIGITPSTNTLPIKRLILCEGESREILTAYVPLPSQVEGDFLPKPAEQRYTCLIPDKRYRYEGLFRAFTAELEIDEAGLVLDYPDTFKRLPS